MGGTLPLSIHTLPNCNCDAHAIVSRFGVARYRPIKFEHIYTSNADGITVPIWTRCDSVAAGRYDRDVSLGIVAVYDLGSRILDPDVDARSLSNIVTQLVRSYQIYDKIPARVGSHIANLR